MSHRKGRSRRPDDYAAPAHGTVAVHRAYRRYGSRSERLRVRPGLQAWLENRLSSVRTMEQAIAAGRRSPKGLENLVADLQYEFGKHIFRRPCGRAKLSASVVSH